MNVPATLRTIEGETRYKLAKLSGDLLPINQETPIQEYKYWVLVENRFPYDSIFAKHDMLVTKREYGNRSEMRLAEYIDMMNILDSLNGKYHVIFENFSDRMSVKTLFHVHLGLYYPTREDMKCLKWHGKIDV